MKKQTTRKEATLDNYTSDCDDNGNYTLKTRRNQMNFVGDDAISIAVLQAQALANFFPGSGRFLVYQISDTEAKIAYDECAIREGIEETHVFEKAQHINSGCKTWKECREFNVLD